MLLDALRAAGLAVARTAAGTLRVTPKERLTDELRAAVRANKAELLAALAAEQGTGADVDRAVPDVGDGAADRRGVGTAHPSDRVVADADHVAERVHAGDVYRGSHSAAYVADVLADHVHGRVLPPLDAPAVPSPLWLWDRLHPLPGIDPTPAPADLDAEQFAGAVERARAAYALIVSPTLPRFRPKPPAVRPAALVDDLLELGDALGWPAVPLRPGETLAEGEACWRRFVEAVPVDRLWDAGRAMAARADAGLERIGRLP